ncbi:MAG: alpha/beta hydrolase-fold protein [Pseudomonadota bacterium]
MTTLDSVIVETPGPIRRSVIWMHGLGADGHDFEPVVPELGLPSDAGVRFIFPHAPVRPVTLNGGMPMRAWFDIASLDRNGPFDTAGIAQSVQQVEALIAAELKAGRSAGDIVLAGFSQGGVIALHTALRYPAALAGVMALSTYLPGHAALVAEASSANKSLPVFLAHGQMDPVLTFDLGEQVRDVLTQAGYPLTWHAYAMAHQVCAEELTHIGGWLREVLKLA